MSHVKSCFPPLRCIKRSIYIQNSTFPYISPNLCRNQEEKLLQVGAKIPGPKKPRQNVQSSFILLPLATLLLSRSTGGGFLTETYGFRAVACWMRNTIQNQFITA